MSIQFEARTYALTTIAVLSALLTSFVASEASAKSYAFTGEWFLNRADTDFPINGGPVACAGLPKTGCVDGFRPMLGGIPGSGIASQMGAGPASFSIPAHAFGQALGLQQNPVVPAASVVQLATSFIYDGPADFPQALQAIPSFGLAQPAVFEKDAWMNDPGQAGRAAAAFAWCPGVGGPACPMGTAATPGPVQGIVQYTPGPNRFGGTMAMVMTGAGTRSSVVGTLTVATSMAGTFMTPVLAHINIGNTPMVVEAPGVSYVYTNTKMIPSAQLYQGFMTSVNGLITSTGPLLTTGGAGMFPLLVPADTSFRWGLPWTTGTVSVMNTEMSGAVSLTGTITAMGSDARTPAGRGMITLVAGGTAHRATSGHDFEYLDVVTINFTDPAPLPSFGNPGLMTLVAVIVFVVGATQRRRFAGKTELGRELSSK